MKNVNSLSLGSAMYAAKRAADIIFILQNKANLSDELLARQLTEALKNYGEKANISLADLTSLKAVTTKLHGFFATQNINEAAKLLNNLLDEYANVPRLSSHGNTPWHLHVDSTDNAPWAEWFAASSSLALAILLAEKQRTPGGFCASPLCGRPFIDSGKGGGRSYCSSTCATRERVAAYRKRGQV